MAIPDAALIERSFAITQQITHTGTWVWCPATGVVSWSDELYRIYGLKPQSRTITQEFFLTCVHPQDRAMVQHGIAQAIERGGKFSWPEHIVRADGSVRLLETVGQVEATPGDGPILFGICRDVTDEQRHLEQVQRFSDIVENVQIGLAVWATDGQERAADFRLAAVNPIAEELAGVELGMHVGQRFHQIFPHLVDDELALLLAKVAREKQVYEVLLQRPKKSGQPALILDFKVFPLPGQSVGVAALDVTRQTFERKLQAAEHAVLEMVAAGAPLKDSLTALVLAVEEHSPPALGSILLLDADGMHVRHAAAPNLPEGFLRAVDGEPIGPHAGSCGTAAFFKEAVFASDIESDERWDAYRAVAREHALAACWSTPILATDQRVLGTFAFYYRVPRQPTDADKALIASVSRLAGIAIERKQMEDQLRDLSAHVEAAVEAERTRIAREIHDDLGQALTALKMDVAWILRRATGGVAFDDVRVIDKLKTMSAFTDETIQRVRRISSELRPGVLDDLGLVSAIEWQAEAFEERTGVTCVVRTSQAHIAVEREIATAVFRIFQEALTNVIRHAEASHVQVRLDLEDRELLLEVRDDGVGITKEHALSSKSLGLIGIRERAYRLGGRVSVEAVSPHGTRLMLRVPVAPEKSA